MVAIIDGAKEEKDRIIGEHMRFGQDAHRGVGPDDARRGAGENGDRHAELWQQGEDDGKHQRGNEARLPGYQTRRESAGQGGDQGEQGHEPHQDPQEPQVVEGGILEELPGPAIQGHSVTVRGEGPGVVGQPRR